MEVKNVYQDNEGRWHIDYGFDHLMGLAIRVYFGQFFIGILTMLFLIVIGIAVSANSTQDKHQIAPDSNSSVPQNTACSQPYQY